MFDFLLDKESYVIVGMKQRRNAPATGNDIPITQASLSETNVQMRSRIYVQHAYLVSYLCIYISDLY